VPQSFPSVLHTLGSLSVFVKIWLVWALFAFGYYPLYNALNMNKPRKTAISIFNFWVESHMRGIFYAWVAITAVEIISHLFWIDWNTVQNIVNWIWIIYSMFSLYSGIVWTSRKIHIKLK
jgi:hypothetical protein